MKAIEVFNIVEKHLLEQNEKSYLCDDEDRSCAYRSERGLKCAVGCLFTDEAYDPAIEGKGILHDERVQAVLEESLGFCPWPELLGLLDDLQGIHDNLNVEEWGQALASLREDVEGGFYELGYWLT